MIQRQAAAATLLLLATLACAPHKARIDDVRGGRAELLSVDGQPVERARSGPVTVVPLGLVDPGAHAFRVRLKADASGAPEETVLVTGTVRAGKRYRFETHDGTLQLVRERDGE